MVSMIDRTLDHIQLLARHLDPYNLRAGIVIILMELGVPTQSMGFEFLKKAIELQREDPTRALSKDVYLEISSHYPQYSEWSIERAIRQAIKKAWISGSPQAWSWYFSYDGQTIANKPTNSEFISRIAYILEIWQECKIAKGRSR
ncbi:MAG: sporulation initiation factor Spo0A C-terminal domain-containing protein [Bacteroidaceae bacterium]|nr:sporulation initiation factor Spo0A C-terminal domain-containing protein [Bacteroidaceae bacterium]